MVRWIIRIAAMVFIGIPMVLIAIFSIFIQVASIEDPTCNHSKFIDIELGDRIYEIPRSWQLLYADGRIIPSVTLSPSYKPCFREGGPPIKVDSIFFRSSLKQPFTFPIGMGYLTVSNSHPHVKSSGVPIADKLTLQHAAIDQACNRLVNHFCSIGPLLWKHGLQYKYTVFFKNPKYPNAPNTIDGAQEFRAYDQQVQLLIGKYLARAKSH